MQSILGGSALDCNGAGGRAKALAAGTPATARVPAGERSLLLAASAGSATTLVLLVMQWLWVKTHWVDVWR